MIRNVTAALIIICILSCSVTRKTQTDQSPGKYNSSFKYIYTGFENASQLDWDVDSNCVVIIGLIYDHERASNNRANGHWHYQVQADAGSDVTIIMKNFDNIWNGRKAYPVTDSTSCLVSKDGINWTAVPTELLPDHQLKVTIHMDSDKMYVASVEPYRISDLERFLDEIKQSQLVDIETVGKTVDGRPLEIIRVGDPNAPHSVFLRARAHSWEPGGNWVVEGLVRGMLENDAAKYLKEYCVYVMPMANKDGVAKGRTRFNSLGADLNRQWDKPANKELTPEKYAFEQWLEKLIANGKKPGLAIDLHNDNFGNLHVNLPTANNAEYTAHMKRFENLLYKYTWFREGAAHVVNEGSFGEGMARRYGIDACVYEFNYEWIRGLQKVPSGKDWQLLGRELRDVFLEYFQ